MVRRLSAVVSLVEALGGCFSSGDGREAAEPAPSTASTAPTTTATTVPEPWAEEAFVFFEALRLVVPDRIDLFYTATATFEGSPLGDLSGRDEIVHLADLGWSIGEVRRLYLSRNRAVYAADLFSSPWPWLVGFEMRDDRIARQVYVMLTDFEGYWRDPDPLGPRLGALHERYFAAWTSGQASRIAALYQPRAVRTDSLFGATRHPGANEGPSDLQVESLVGEAPRYEAAKTTGDLDGDGRPDQEWAVFTVQKWREEVPLVHVLFDVTGSHCTVRLLAVWEIEGERIASEEILHDVESLRRCADRAGMGLPGGWWTGLEAPAPFIEAVTGHIPAADGSSIEIINGSPDLIDLVEWGLGRFEAAQLALPTVDTIAFPPSERCPNLLSHTGYATLGAETIRVDLCISEGGTAGSRTVLHELGHVWEYQNLDEPTRQAFLDLRGLEAWIPTDSDLPWQDGIEHAAETISWGLMDQPIGIKIPDTTTQDLAEAFRLLTGVEPLNVP